MNCEKMTENIPMLINGTMSAIEEKESFEHLMECEECRLELAFWTQIADSQKSFDHEFGKSQKEAAMQKLIKGDASVYDVIKSSVKVYFKVIKIITNF